MQTLEETVLKPIMWAVAWLMVGFHKAFTYIGIPADSGWSWALSIVGLTVVIRIILIPLFVKQIHASRRMQLIQPEMQKIQKKYKGKSDPESRQAMTQETMDLYKRTGTNPFSSCLPILLQSPIFFALYRVLIDLDDVANGSHKPIGGLTRALAQGADTSTIFGASLSSSFMGTDQLNVRILTVILIIMMSVSMFLSQHQLMRKNMPAAALDNPMAKQQKYLIYLMPVFFFFTGPNFPIGVLIYWVTTNVWSMGQQFYVIRNMPAPGSAAEKALEERRAKKGKPHTKLSIPGLHSGDSGDSAEETVAEEEAADGALPGGKVSGQRQQPKRKDRQRRPGAADDTTAGEPSSNGNGPESSGATAAGADGRPGTGSGAGGSGTKGTGGKASGGKGSGGKSPGGKSPGGKGSGAKPTPKSPTPASGSGAASSGRPSTPRRQPKKKGKGPRQRAGGSR
ncbi:MAG TPA: membrane protein insertase YidC [Segeticoccus sp.]|nr:membrane protein insertase YidC [Segeticoccus sp.]